MRSLLRLMLLLSGACAVAAWGQSTFGSIVGTVRDPSGAPVAGAQIMAKEAETGISVSIVSGEEGLYEFTNLKPGRYVLVAVKAGFADSGSFEVALDSRRIIRSDLELQLPTAQQAVTVQETRVAINTENGTIADSKNFAQITQLPLNFRGTQADPLAALTIVPGAQIGSYRTRVSLGGGGLSEIEYSIDGISSVAIGGNVPLLNAYPSPEGFAEFKVTSTGAGAEFGQMGDVAIVTRGGTNQLHGSILWYHQNAALDAKTYGAVKKQAKVDNTFGASLGGPVVLPGLYRGKDRTFFYGDYEGNRQPGSTLVQQSVPTAEMRGGNLLGVPGLSAVDPLDSLPFPGNRIPSTRLNSVATKLFSSYYPLPNYNSGSTLNNYRILARNDSATNRYDLRIDHHLGKKQQVFARWSAESDGLPAFFGSYLLPPSQYATRSHSLVVSHDYTFSPAWVNEFRFGVTHSSSIESFPIRGSDVVSGLGIQGLNLSQVGNAGGFPYFQLYDGYFGSVGHGRESDGTSRNIQFTDNLSWIKGRHTFKFGLDARWLAYSTTLHFGFNDDFGGFSFRDGAFSGNGFADLLLGLPAVSYYASLGPNLLERSLHTDFYGQDQWQVSRRVTLTLGLRWELVPGMTEDSGNISNFNPRNGDIIIPDYTLPAAPGFLAGANACPGTTPDLPCTTILTASQAGLPQSLVKTHYNNWAPRFGFAVRPFKGNRTVLRGGIGLYVVTLLGGAAYPLTGIHTSDVREFDNYRGPGVPPVFALPQAYGGIFNLTSAGNSSLCCLLNPDLRNPRSLQWNFTVEQALPSNLSMRVSYVASQTSGLLKFADLNQVPASITPYSQSQAPYPVWTSVKSFENLGFTNYQSLQTEVSRRFRAGLFFQASYTLAKEIGNAGNTATSDFPPEAPFGGIPIDRFNTRLDRGDFGASRRHRFVLTGIFPVPVGRGRAFAGRLHGIAQAVAGGWDLSTVTLLQSGPYQTPSMSVNLDRSNTNLAARSFLARPDRIADGNLSDPTRARYYDIAAFTAPPVGAGRFGNAGAGILQAPGTIAIAAGLSKTFAVTERFRLRMEGTFTNLPNHPNFLQPVVNISNPNGFGKLTSVQSSENSGNRTGQVGVRVQF